MIMLIGSRQKGNDKDGGGILSGGLLGGILGRGGGSQEQMMNNLVNKMDSAGKRCGAVYKKQKTIEGKVDQLADEWGVTLQLEDVSVDYGQDEIRYFTELVERVEKEGEDIGLLTKVTALNKLSSLFSKMTRNIGKALKGQQRTEKKIDALLQHLKKEDAEEPQHP